MSAERRAPGRGAALSGALLCLLGTWGLYLHTAAPVVQGFDSAELTVGAYSLGFVHPPGYPLYILVAQAFLALPLGDPGQQLGLMSATLGALAVAGLYWLILDQTRDRAAALLGAGLLAIAPVFWSQAIRAEVYTLHGLLVVAALLLSRRALVPRTGSSHGGGPQAQRRETNAASARPLSFVLRRSSEPAADSQRAVPVTGRPWPIAAAFLLLGVALANHQATALLWLALLGVVPLLPPRQRVVAATGCALGLGVMALIYAGYFGWRVPARPVIDYIQPYFAVDLGTPRGLLWMLSGQAFRCGYALSPTGAAANLARLALLVLNSSLGVGLVMAMWGWLSLGRREPAWNTLLSLYALLNVAAFFIYQVVDKEVMFAPLAALIAIWAAEGLPELRKRLAHVVAGGTSAERWAVPLLAGGLALAVALNWGDVSLRDSTRVYGYTEALLGQVEPETTIVSTWVSAAMLDYLQVVEGRRRDVANINVDFYLLGRGGACGDAAAAKAATAELLAGLAARGPLCVTHPLVPAPPGLTWSQDRLCWTLRQL